MEREPVQSRPRQYLPVRLRPGAGRALALWRCPSSGRICTSGCTRRCRRTILEFRADSGSVASSLLDRHRTPRSGVGREHDPVILPATHEAQAALAFIEPAISAGRHRTGYARLRAVPVAARNAFQTLGFSHGIRRVDRWVNLSSLPTGVTESCHDIWPGPPRGTNAVDVGSSYS